MKVSVKAIFLSLALLLGLMMTVRADMLAELPKDAPLVIVTKPIADVSSDLNTFLNAIGAPMESPLNLADELSDKMNLPTAIDETRPLAMAVSDPDNAEDSLLLIVPVKNADALKAAFEADPSIKPSITPGIWTLDAGDGSLMYLKPQGEHLKVAPNLELLNLSAGTLGFTFTPEEQKIVEQSHFCCRMNLAAFQEKVAELIDFAKERPELAKNPGMQVMPWYLEQFKNMETVIVGAMVKTTGLHLSVSAKAKSGTALAKSFNGHPKGDFSILGKLPNKEFATAVALNFEPQALAELNNDFFTLLNKAQTDTPADQQTAPVLAPEDMKQIQDAMAQALKTYGNKGGYAEYTTMMAAPTGNMFDTVNYQGVFECRDAKAMQTNLVKIMPLVEKLMNQAMKIPFTYKTDAGQAAAKSYDLLTVDMTQVMQEAAGAQNAPAANAKMVLNEYLCFLPNNKMVFAMNPQHLEELLKFQDSPAGDGLDKNPLIVEAAKNLPPQANAYFFTNLGAAMRQIMMRQQQQGNMDPGMMMMAGLFSSMQGTIAGSAVMENEHLNGTCVIPASLIQNFVLMFTQMQSGMGQPMPGGPTMMEEDIEYEEGAPVDESEQTP